MCRWIVLLTDGAPLPLRDLLVAPKHSLISQAFDASFHPGFTGRNNAVVNADGFGVAWYASDCSSGAQESPARLCLFKSTSPAWSDPNLAELVHYIRANVVFGHVRAASPGSVVSFENCHPFKCGRLAFMHNGHVEKFAALKRALVNQLSDAAFHSIRGLTDSEHCFALLLSALGGGASRAAPFEPAELARAMVATIAALLALVRQAGITSGFTSLNFALTDGCTVVATRFCDQWPAVPPPSLYFAFPPCADLAAELSGSGGGSGGGGGGASGCGGSGPGDGSAAPAAAGGAGAAPGGLGGAAALPAPACFEADHRRRAERWHETRAFLAACSATAAPRALLIASEPATEGSAGVQWLCMPANCMLVYTAGSGQPPVLTPLETLLPEPAPEPQPGAGKSL